MRFSTRTSASAEAAYAQLFDVARHDELERSIGSLVGSFASTKGRAGELYWYFQYTDVATGKNERIFVGPDNDQVRDLIKRKRESAEDALIERLAKSAIALGCAPVQGSHFRVIRRLNEVGFFHAGGVLVGTHAFLAFGNAMGLAWDEAARTVDVDVAHAGSEIQLALPGTLRIQVRDAITSLDAGFLPVPPVHPWSDQATARFRSRDQRELTVDFLTPKGARKQKGAYRHEQLGVNLQPIEFLEFLLEEVGQAVVIGPSGAVVVNVPDPARYALHKLIVHVKRKTAKAAKDLGQAAALLEAMETSSIPRLWRDMIGRGKDWKEAATAGRAALEKLAPDLEVLKALKA